MRTRWGWAWALLLGLAACSPSLNWRTVPVEQLATLLPCKPDHAVRTVDLGGAQQTLSMWGCEAGGALFAISHLRVGSAASSQPLIAAWQQAALRNISGSTAQTLPFQAPALAGQTPALGTMVRTSGKRADGQTRQEFRRGGGEQPGDFGGRENGHASTVANFDALHSVHGIIRCIAARNGELEQQVNHATKVDVGLRGKSFLPVQPRLHFRRGHVPDVLLECLGEATQPGTQVLQVAFGTAARGFHGS